MKELAKELQKISTLFEKISILKTPIGLYNPLKLVLDEDKRHIAGASVILGSELFRGSSQDTHYAACGIELFYRFSCIRGNAISTTNCTYSPNSNFFPTNTSILSGDAMHILAYDMIIKCRDIYMVKVLKIFTEMCLKVFEGYQLEQNVNTMQTLQVSDYIRMSKLKMSEIIGAGLKIGAMVGDTSDTDQNKVYELGRFIGTVMQIDTDYKLIMNSKDRFMKKELLMGEYQANLFLFYVKDFEKSSPLLELYQNSDKDIILTQAQVYMFKQKMNDLKNYYLTCFWDLLSKCEFSDKQNKKFDYFVSKFFGFSHYG